MNLEFEDAPSRFTAFVAGAIGWNDRLALSRLVPLLRESRAHEFAIDMRGCTERDAGASLGLRSTGERMARLIGKRFLWLAA